MAKTSSVSITINAAAIAEKLIPIVEEQCREHQAILASAIEEAAANPVNGGSAIVVHPYGSNTPKAKVRGNGIECKWNVVVPHRYKSSMYTAGGYSRVNIVALFNDGYDAGNRVYADSGYTKGYQVSLTHRDPSMFVQRGIQNFEAATGYTGIGFNGF